MYVYTYLSICTVVLQYLPSFPHDWLHCLTVMLHVKRNLKQDRVKPWYIH